MFWQRMNMLGFDQFIFPDWYMSIAYYDLKKWLEGRSITSLPAKPYSRPQSCFLRLQLTLFPFHRFSNMSRPPACMCFSEVYCFDLLGKVGLLSRKAENLIRFFFTQVPIFSDCQHTDKGETNSPDYYARAHGADIQNRLCVSSH